MFPLKLIDIFSRAPDKYQMSDEFKSACDLFENDDLSKGNIILHIILFLTSVKNVPPPLSQGFFIPIFRT